MLNVDFPVPILSCLVTTHLGYSAPMPVKHPPPRAKEITQVISLGGNQCAFDACERPIFVRGEPNLVGEIAHVKARREGGPRFDPNQTAEQNRSVENLMAVCKEHGDVIDDEDHLAIYTVERLQEMKRQHEAKVERRADRGWIRHSNSITRMAPNEDGDMQQITLHYWIDRTEQLQIYTPRQKEIVDTLLRLYLDLNVLCQLQEVATDNPDAPGRSLLQSYSTMKVDGVNPATGTPWTPMAHILRTMARLPEITFGEFTKFLLSPKSNATDLFVAMEKQFKSKPDPD